MTITTALGRLAEAAAASADASSFLERAASELAPALVDGWAALAVVDPAREDATIVPLSRGGGAASRLGGVRVDPDLAGAAPAGRAVVLEALPEPLRAELARAGGAAAVAVPLAFRSERVGVLLAASREAPAPALGTELGAALAAHVGAMLAAERISRELGVRAGELALLHDLSVASSALDPALLLDEALRRTCATLQADAAAGYLTEGAELALAASCGLSPEAARHVARVAPGRGPAGLAYGERRVVQADERDAPGAADPWPRESEAMAVVVGAPLLARGRRVGALVLGRRGRDRFDDAELSLLPAIGVQLGVAVENARLLADARRRVADLEAVNALALRLVGTPPDDVRGMLTSTCREIARALGARSAVVLRLDDEGRRLVGVAGHGTPLPPATLAIPIEASALAARALRRQEPVWGLHVFDAAPPGGEPAPPPLSLLLVPLTSRRSRPGVVAVGDRPDRRYSDAEVALASALAGEAAMAIENAELYAEAQRRVEELSLLNEVGRKVAGSLDLDHVLREGAGVVRRLVAAAHGHVLLLDARRAELRLAATTNEEPDALRQPPIPVSGPSLCAAAVRERRPVALHDASAAAPGVVALACARGARSVLAAPLLVHDAPVGAIVVSEHERPRRFAAAEIERVMAVANHLAVAIDNGRLYEDLRRSYADLRRAQEQLVRKERLAALGELSAVVAHEVRNPLGVIFNSLGSLRRMLQPKGDTKLLLDIVGEEADRLNRIVGALLDFANPAPPALRPERLDAVLDDAISAALVDAGGRVELARDLPDDLPPVPMDARLVRQALLNVALNAVQAMPQGGTLSVRARVDGDAALLEIGDTGTGVPPDVRARMFEPFFTTKPTGSGLGLAVVKQIVDDHHGGIDVRDGPAGGTVLAIRLPLDAAGGARTG